MKLLIDECLSPKLVTRARAEGFSGSSHIVWLGLAGRKDWELKTVIVDGDWTFVTKNAIDFRGPAERRGSGGHYADLALHAGLVCLNGPVGMDLDMQLELFDVALERLVGDPDLVNRVLEVTLADDVIHVLRYALPA